MLRGTWIAATLAAGIGIMDASASETQTATPADEIAEVTVTAQKREERLQDVPIAISAFNADQLQSRGIENIRDLGSLAPNLQISNSPGTNTGSQISIRGGVQINPALFWDPTVGVYIDGVYISKSLGSVFDIVDLARVEVLRGPQGTLYGRNTLAGAINLVTRQPSGEWRGEATIDYGRFDDRIVKFSLDLPKAGIASLSVGGRIQKRDGFPQTTAGSSAPDLDNRDQKAARIALNLDFTPTFTAAYRYDYSDINQNPQMSYLLRADPTVLPFLQPYVTSQRLSTVSIDGPVFERSKVQGHAITLTWDINEHNVLKSITAYRKLTWDDSLDLDGSPVLVAHTSRLSDFSNRSQEFQLVGSTDRLNYVGGLFYYRDDGYTRNPQHFFFDTLNFDSEFGFLTRAYSAYTQLDYKITDAFTLTAGGRYTHEKKGINRFLGVNFAPGDPFLPLIPAGTSAEQSFSATTPLLTLAYKFNGRLNTYIKYSEGFKSGGFNGEYGDVGSTPQVIQTNIQETQTPFKPEKQKALELGLKSNLADGRLQLEAAVFQNKTSDLQLSIFRATGAASSIIRNAGKATVRGAELEVQWRPLDRLRLQGSYGYLHARYDEFIDKGVNVADDRAFVHAPKNTFNIVADALLAHTDWGGLDLIADYNWTDSFYTYPYQLKSSGPQYDPTAAVAGDSQVRSYGILNMRLALVDIPAGPARAEAALWARNLTDYRHFTNVIDFGPGFGSLTSGYYPQPRTYGVELTVRW